MRSSKPRSFWLHFNRFGQKRGEKVWTVHLSNQCIQTKKVIVMVPIETIYKGDSARQPRAFLKGVGIIDVFEDHVTIS